jgi:hypothetical protein
MVFAVDTTVRIIAVRQDDDLGERLDTGRHARAGPPDVR